MEKFTIFKGLVAPLDRSNVDTDAIIPKQFLKSIYRTGYGPNLFDEWRYLDKGEPGKPQEQRVPNPDFVLNQPRFENSKILLTRKNFGCGSSREHAAWALTQYGFRVVIAPSFADIFYNNAFKNGLLPLTLPEIVIDRLFEEIKEKSGYELSVDLVNRVVIEPNGTKHEFEVPEFRRYCLLNGLDDIGITLQHADEIEAFEQHRLAEKPWLVKTIY